eukprot:SAG11_NODE_3359_length_2501_cov_1.511657_4_plen_90_part_01
MAVSTFRDNDPFHFGNLGLAMLTLFRCSTGDDWTDIMYFQAYSCAFGVSILTCHLICAGFVQGSKGKCHAAQDYAGATGNTQCIPEQFGW